MFSLRPLCAVALGLIFGTLSSAHAQLGSTDRSSFSIQNIDSIPATVTISFVDAAGTKIAPPVLNGGAANPFSLPPGDSFEVYVPGIPALADGRYSVVIDATAKVSAIANIAGQGTKNFNGSYSGASTGATRAFLPSVVYNFYGWNSLISVQNAGSGTANVSLKLVCNGGGAAVTQTIDAIPPGASRHLDFRSNPPGGLSQNTSCSGSAEFTSNQPIVVVDNQSVAAAGNTQSISGAPAGAPKLFAPALYTSYYGWNSSLNLRKVQSGNTTVTVKFSDGGSKTCTLSDLTPGCLLYMPNAHVGDGYFAATIESKPPLGLVAVVSSANGSQAQAYSAVASGSSMVGIPSLMKDYYGWSTSLTCQNVGTIGTKLRVHYTGYGGSDYATTTLAPGATIERFTGGEAFLPYGFRGGAQITALTPGAKVTCIVNLNNASKAATEAGDWSMSYNAE